MTPDAKALLARYQPRAVKMVPTDRQLGTVRFSPCGKYLAAGDFEGRVRRWSFAEGASPLTSLPALTGHSGWVQALAFHPDGKHLLTADSWGRLTCWPFAERAARSLWSVQAHDGWVRQIAVSPDGKQVVTCGKDGKVCFWSPDRGAKVKEWAGLAEDTFSLAFDPEAKSLAAGGLRGTIRRWDVASGKVVREYAARALYRHDRIQDVGGVRWLTFDRTGATLVAAGCLPTSGGFVQGTPLVLLFDVATGRLKQEIKIGTVNDGFVYEMHWHRDGFLMGVTSGQPGQGSLFFLRPGDAQPFFTARLPNCHALAAHPDGTRLIVSATNANSSGNGRPLTKAKEYPGNFSPLHLWALRPAS